MLSKTTARHQKLNKTKRGQRKWQADVADQNTSLPQEHDLVAATAGSSDEEDDDDDDDKR